MTAIVHPREFGFLSPSERWVLVASANLCSQGDSHATPLNLFAHITGFSVATLKKHLKRLEELHKIEIDWSNCKHAVTTFKHKHGWEITHAVCDEDYAYPVK
ncbi:hypothetical protein [Sansalvadorimonas verongulae]|uniref:hypothetical protein n=1 Tax=Sansalvadorimonas verongulae TaxID=2172824 RepID=UPI0012BC254D|nr:hypothetical protein [Sansalvadorimonas verongulae]MTI13192.1 hypothetical protein [Sansalvadorimonas verongulae]